MAVEHEITSPTIDKENQSTQLLLCTIIMLEQSKAVKSQGLLSLCS